jgi:hypothetical protein
MRTNQLSRSESLAHVGLIEFVNDGAEIRKILDYIGIEPIPPKISKARGPPL